MSIGVHKNESDVWLKVVFYDAYITVSNDMSKVRFNIVLNDAFQNRVQYLLTSGGQNKYPGGLKK